MAKITMKFDYGKIGYDKLVSDEDFTLEAKRLLPAAMKQYATAVAEVMWSRIECISSIARTTFIRDKIGEISKNRTKNREIEAQVVEDLRKGKINNPLK